MRRCLPLGLVVASLVAAAPAWAGVRVVDPFPLERYADRAAIGLLVPGAGPEVTREGALSALLRGKLEHDLLGGVARGEPLIRLGDPSGPEILVSLPPPGRSRNDRRYPIALLGERGLLTSDSTRIDGLVSVTDVATGRLRVVPDADPVAALNRLDTRIDRNDRWKLPLTILLVGAVIALALVRPRLALRVLLLGLALNLWLSPWLAALAALAALALPLGWACAALLAAYLAALGLDAETVALSPYGPSQSGRFYGIDNLLETMLLVPALVGAALLGGRRALAVAALALVAVGGNRFGADGGGLLVLLAGFVVLGLRLRVRRPTPKLVAAAALAAVALALAIVGIDALTGGESHVTRAVGDGPGALLGDLGDRLELSARRTLAGSGPLGVVLVGGALLVALALRTPRRPLLDALLAALAVSLLVNDSPGDVVAVGVAGAILLARFPLPQRAAPG